MLVAERTYWFLTFTAIIDPEEITVDKARMIGKGGEAEVFRGKYSGQDVAVKRFPVPMRVKDFADAAGDEMQMLL